MRGPVLPLSLTMAWRETRGSWRRFVFFILCVAVGVGAVVGIDLFAVNVEGLILNDARSLLGGDVEIRLARPLGRSGIAVIDTLKERDVAVTHVRELVGMAAVVEREAGVADTTATDTVAAVADTVAADWHRPSPFGRGKQGEGATVADAHTPAAVTNTIAADTVTDPAVATVPNPAANTTADAPAAVADTDAVADTVDTATAPAAARGPAASRPVRLVELKAVESNYPLYGRVGVSPDESLHALLAPVASCPRQPCFGIVVQDSLLIMLGLDRGAHLRIGRAWFEITGVLLKEPDRVTRAFSLGPRVMISRDALAATDLVRTGSRIRQRYLLRVPASMALEPLLGALRNTLAADGARVSSFRQAQPRIRNFLDQFTTWLGLMALTALLVGGLGIACTMHGFITHKLATVAILKTLGADAGLIMRVYLGQSGLMGGVGSVLGAAGGVALQMAMPVALGDLLPVTVGATVSVMPLVKGFLLGLGVTVLFTVWPLLTIRAAPPALVFRRDVAPGGNIDTGIDTGTTPGVGTRVEPGGDVGGDMGMNANVDAGIDTGMAPGVDTRTEPGTTPGVDTCAEPGGEPGVTGHASSRRTCAGWVCASLTRAGQSLRQLCRDRQRLLAGVVIGAGLLALVVWQARSATLGAVFLLAFGAALVLLRAGAWLLLEMLRRAPRPHAPVVRYALGRVRRPGHDTMSMTLAIGVGVMVMATVAMVKTSLLAEIGDRIPESAPTFFFLDIQPDQRPSFERIVRAHTPAGAYALTPVVRSRLAAINGARVNPEAHAETRHGWYFTREYVLTESADLPEGNVIVKGDWWPPAVPENPSPSGRGAGVRVRPEAPAAPNPASVPALDSGSVPALDQAPLRSRRAAVRVSVEEEAARVLGLDVGSTVTFDVQGAPLSAVVAGIRQVDWGSFSTNFYMILSPTSLRGTPLTYLSTATVDPDNTIPLQQALVRALPNVTAIQIGDVLANVAHLLEQLARVIQGMAFLSLVSGATVMVAALSSTRYRRVYESAVLKVMGGTRRLLAQSFALEFAVVGALAGGIGVTLAGALSWAILYFVLDMPWVWQPGVMFLGLTATVGLAMIVGLTSTWRVLGEPPLAVLRRE